MKILCAGLAILVLSLSPSISYAGNCGNSNHSHSPEALRTMAQSYFNEMDLNGDGIVEKQEFEKSEMAKSVKSFEMLQPDDTGAVRLEAFVESFVTAHSKAPTET